MMAPALGQIGQVLHVSDEEANMALSIFVLAFAFGPLVLAPFSEVFGRKRVWVVSSFWYSVWNLCCGFAERTHTMIAARFFAGLGSSAQFAVIVDPALLQMLPQLRLSPFRFRCPF